MGGRIKLVLPPNMQLLAQETMGPFFSRVAESEWAEIHMYCANEAIAKFAEKMCCRWHDYAHGHIDPRLVYIVVTDERMTPWIVEGMKDVVRFVNLETKRPVDEERGTG